ncbi:MAG TPA: FadR/GntR family transcriptional regulator [Bordetella sp.]
MSFLSSSALLDNADALRSEPNLTDRVAGILLDEVTGGRYQIGDVLPPEQAMATQLGVSRTVLREAVSRLKADGFVQSKQGRGLTVMQTSRPSVLRMYAADDSDVEQVLHIVELRRAFEAEAAMLAAQRRDADDLAALGASLQAMARALASGDVAAGTAADVEFHRRIARATHNEYYLSFFDFLSLLLKKNLQISRTKSAQTGRGDRAQKEHEMIYAAIEQGDAVLARQCARAHIENTEARLRSERAAGGS